MHRRLIVVLALVLLFPTSCFAWKVTLSWDANAEPDLAGYKVYYDTSPGDPYYGTEADQGTSPITIMLEDLSDQNSPEFTITGLISGFTYYFVVTAFNANTESDYSNEVSAKYEDARSGSEPSDGGGGGDGCFISTTRR